jgi:threonine/homoserine/homoserine lactone efflux protein
VVVAVDLIEVNRNISFYDSERPHTLAGWEVVPLEHGAFVMYSVANWLFMASAIALLGSPGPGIVALLAVGRVEGWGALRFYAGLQLGLAMAFAATAVGLLSLLEAVPFAVRVMTLVSAGYLIYLAYQIATVPVGSTPQAAQARSSSMSGFVLGIANPKAYLAFASLLASQTLVEHDRQIDVVLKWFICVIVAILVDLAWLFVGVRLQRAVLRPLTERIINVTLGATILLVAIFTLFEAFGRGTPERTVVSLMVEQPARRVSNL